MLQLFLEAHFVYLYLVHSLELSLALFLSPILSYTLDRSGLSFYVYRMYAIRFSHATYLLSHAYDIHMLTDFTCLSLSHVYRFISSIKYPL